MAIMAIMGKPGSLRVFRLIGVLGSGVTVALLVTFNTIPRAPSPDRTPELILSLHENVSNWYCGRPCTPLMSIWSILHQGLVHGRGKVAAPQARQGQRYCRPSARGGRSSASS